MKSDELEELEAAEQLRAREEYPAAIQLYRFEVQVGERLFLANKVDIEVYGRGDAAYFELTLTDAWAFSAMSPIHTRGRVQIFAFDNVVVEDRKPA